MENATVASTAVAPLSHSGAIDEHLLQSYTDYLAAEGIVSQKREPVLATAREFLAWWRRRFVGDEYRISLESGMWPRDEAASWSMRETYLRHVSPDHQGRCDERIRLNRFLRFVGVQSRV